MLLLRSPRAIAEVERDPEPGAASPPESSPPESSLPNAGRRRRPVLRKAATFILIGTAAFLVVAVGLRQLAWSWLGVPYIEVMTEKLDYFRSHAAQYNTVVVGSSRVFRTIDPPSVEASAAEHGCPGLSVFNFGIPSLSHSEQNYLLQQILAARPDNLKRIIFEDALHETRDYINATTPRGRYFHSFRFAADKLRNIWTYPESFGKRLFRTQIFLRAFLYENSGIGLWSQLSFGKTEEEQPAGKLSLERAGFLALDNDPDERLVERHQELLSNYPLFDDMVALKNGVIGPQKASERAGYLVEEAQHLQSAGVQVGLIVPPNPSTLRFTSAITASVGNKAPNIAIFDYNRKDTQPSIFQHSLWFDLNHLTEAGATKVSRQFGEDLCAAIKAGKI